MSTRKPVATAHFCSTSPNSFDGLPFTLVLESAFRPISLDVNILQEAICGPVLVMDAGNCFNPLRLTRQIRQHTLQIQQVLNNILVARAFTCFQVIALLEKTQNPIGPVFILRLLTTFRDEMIPIRERLQLLKQVDAHINHLRSAVAVTLVIKNSCFQDDPLLDWLSGIQDRADSIIYPVLQVLPKPQALF